MKKIYLLILLTFIQNSWSQEYKRMIATGTYTVQEIQQEAETYFNIVGTERGKGYKPYKRWEYNALRNMSENGMLKAPSFYFNELERYNNYINGNAESSLSTTTGNWEELGPTSWNRTSGWNPGVGRITSIVVDKTDTNHIIVGANTGGVWKSIDGGSTWTVLTDNLSNLNVYALAIDPNDSMTYFWGSSSGNIFKSTDGGSTWNLFADTGNGNVNKILIDPTDSSKLYCSAQGGGIFKSINGGQDWSIIHPLATNGYDIEFKPGNTAIIYASGNKFFKSIDGGATFMTDDPLNVYTQEFISGTTVWTSAASNQNNTVAPKTGSRLGLFYIGNFSHPVTQLISPALDLTGSTNPQLKFSYSNVQWAGDIDELKILYKTSTAGNWIELANYTSEITSWQDIIIDLPNPSAEYYVAFEGKSNYGRGVTLDDVSVEDTTLGILFENSFESSDSILNSGPKMMGVSENDDSIVYILEASGSVFGALYKSTDDGDTFTELNHAGKNYFGYSSTASDNSGQAPRDMDITVNPNDANEVHIAGVLSWMSTDGGDNFNLTSQWTHTNAAAANVGYCHADIDILEYVDGKLYVGSDGGIFVAENPLIINTDYYTDLTSGLGIRQFYKIGVSQTNPEVISGGAQDNGTSVMDINGNWTDWLGADGMESFVDKNDSNILYGTSQSGSLYKSYNGGASYNGISSPEGKSGNWITPFEQDPITQDVIYSGYDEVYKSINGGSSWTSISTSQNFGGNLNHLKIAQSNNNILFAARGSSLYKTDNGGNSWNSLNGYSGNINSIAIHPTDANKIAVATNSDQKVYVSSDGGINWTSYLHDLPDFNALALVWQNNDNNGLYVGMNYGVYYIDDATPNNWIPFSNSLPNVQISELEINTETAKIYAGTYGRGLWKSDLYDASLSVNEFEINNISIYPNPVSEYVNIKWNKSDLVTLKLFSSTGSLVFYQKNTNLIEPHKVDTSKLSSGIYYLKINTLNSVTTKKIIIK
ncbi:MAG: hypothetical protein COA67_07075 [Lutibacter sp.]|nr:MAG: hypothetical protein COA67_07075 [Lutibacter sp.]